MVSTICVKRMSKQIIGSKGGGGGASFVTKPDTLRSDDSFEILLGLGSGRWKGLVEGLNGLKINGVPLENLDGTSNFEDVAVLFGDGNPLVDQLVNFKLGGGGATQSINTPLSNSNSSGAGPWIVGAVNTQNADFIDLRFIVQQLFYQDTKSIRENTANIEIQMRPTNSSTWINIFSAPNSSNVTYDPSGYDFLDGFGSSTVSLYLSRSMFKPSGTGFKASTSPYLKVTGKTSSAYAKEVRVAVPKEGNYDNVGWEVRARLLEKDDIDNGDIQERRLITFEGITAIIKEPLGADPEWDGQVWMQLIGKASDQFNGFPEIEGVFDTKICKTPPGSVWDAVSRVYTGETWDGSYEEHFTTDPAWQIKEFIEDPIHGVAGLQPGSSMDKWDALEASKYFSELVPDGRGGTHPRFNMNLTLNEARDVNDMLQYLAGSVNSYIEDVGDGQWRLKVDKPETPKVLFTEDNVFGDFSYSHTDVDTRFNDWRGTYLNEDFDYEQDTVRVFDQPDIDQNGTKFTEVALIGCTNRQEALRRLMFRLRISLNEYRIVNFQTNRIGRYISPLDTILVADGALDADFISKSTSRVDEITGTSVKLLRPLRLEAGINYSIHFTTVDKETISRVVTNTAQQRGDVEEVTIDSPLPEGILPESAVALEAQGLYANPLSYRVLSVERSEEDEDVYLISASIVDSGKWDAMDNVSEIAIAAQAPNSGIDAPGIPENGMFSLVEYDSEFGLKKVLQVNWDRPGSLFLDGYKVQYRLNNGPWLLAAENIKDSYFELQNPEDGSYDFKITALDRRGLLSIPLVGSYNMDGVLGDQGSSGYTLVNRNGTKVGIDSIEKVIQTTAWDSSATSAEAFTGGCSVSFVLSDGNNVVCGFSENPTGSNSSAIDHGILSNGAGLAYAQEGNSAPVSLGAYDDGDIGQVIYKGTTVTYLIGGEVRRTIAATEGKTYFLDTSLLEFGDRIEGIRFVGVGADGVGSYVHIAYADSDDGATNFSLASGERVYLGQYVSQDPIQSSDPSDYQWSKIVGDDGYSTAQILVYKRSATQPAKPSAPVTWTFATRSITGLNNGWSLAQPADNGELLWASGITFSSRTATDTAAASEFTTPTGLPGGGADGLNQAPVFLFKRSATVPAKPTGDISYNFSTGAVTGLTNGWTKNHQASNGDPEYVIQATAISIDSADTIPASEFSNPVLYVKDGIDGADGVTAEITGPASVGIPCSDNGTPKPNSYDEAGGKMQIRKDGVIQTAGVSYTVVENINCSVIIDSQGNYQPSNLGATNAHFILRATFDGDPHYIKVTMYKTLDGPSAIRGSDGGGVSASASFVEVVDAELAAPAGATIGASGVANFNCNINNTSVRCQLKITLENVTDGGSEVDLVTGAPGDYATLTFFTDNTGEIIINDDPGSAAASTTFVVPTNGAKLYRARLYMRRDEGNTGNISGKSTVTLQVQ